MTFSSNQRNDFLRKFFNTPKTYLSIHANNSFPQTLSKIRKIYETEKEIITLLRIFNTRSMILLYAIGLKFAGVSFFSIDFLIVALIFIITYASASLMNYAADIHIDRLNNRHNPFLKYNYFNQFLKQIIILCITISLILSIFTQNKVIVLIGTITILVLGYIYSYPPIRLSYNPIGKLISMGLTYAYIPSFMGILSGPAIHNILLLFFLGSLYVSWLPYSDIKDIKGDKAYGKRTIAVVLGERNTSVFCFVVSSICITALLFFLPNKNFWILPVSIFLLILTIQGYLVYKPFTLLSKKFQLFGGYLVLGSLLLIAFLY